MNITKNHVVSIHYSLKDSQGTLLDSSEGKTPLTYIQGLGHIIPGLENALEGKGKGEKLQVTIPPEQAYGERNDQMTQSVPKTEFQDADKITPGMQFQVNTEDGGTLVVTVLEVRDSEVVLDGNHPLAGVTLHFNVEVVNIRQATEEELSHGHVHGEGGVHH